MNPQEALPLHLQYRRDEDVIRAEQALSSIVEITQRKLDTTNHVNPKQFAEHHVMPIVAHLVQFFSLQNADLIKYTQSAIVNQLEQSGVGTETMVGIPPDDVEAFVSELESLDKFMVKIDSLGGNKREALEEVKKEAKEFRTAIRDMAEAIQDYSLEEGEDGEEFFEFEDDEEEIKEEDEPIVEEAVNE